MLLLLAVLLSGFQIQGSNPIATPSPDDERPNIVLIMVDDMGFSDVGSYGGEIETPNIDRLGERGIRFTQFYNTAKCFPTRASLMTGLYAHQVGMGFTHGTIRNGVTIAEVLREAGYRTLMAGKWHGDENPYDRGFDRFFGLVDGAVNHFNPGYQRAGEPPPARKTPGNRRKWAIDEEVWEPYTPADPEFYSTDAYTEYALHYLDDYANEDRPFFLYLSYTAPHDPIQARPEDIDKYRDIYTAGWDELRQHRYERQVESGIIDSAWALSPRGSIRDHQKQTSKFTGRYWDDEGRILPWDEVEGKEDWAHKMAVYAAMVDRVDQQVGHLMAKIREMGEEENTLVIFLSDNGGSAEMNHNQQNRNFPPVDPPGPMSAWHSVDAPWANLSNAPFRYYKNWSHEGGISTPFITYWPRGIVEPGRISQEVSHLIDVMATAVDLAGADYPDLYRGERIAPLEGRSLVPILKGREREGHEAIYFEWDGGKAIRSGEWKLVDGRGAGTRWELYDMTADRTETNDLSEEHPEQVDRLSSMWYAWAERVGALKEPTASEDVTEAAPIRLILRGDNFGSTHAATSVLEEAFKDSVVTSASLMVPGPWFAQSASIARTHPEWSVGVHATINSEFDEVRWGPLSEDVPSLIAPDGNFYQRGYGSGPPDPLCRHCARGAADPSEVERELRAQIDAARLQGLRVDYIDCHRYDTCRDDLYPVMQRLAEEYCVPIADAGFLGEETVPLDLPSQDGIGREDFDVYKSAVLNMLRSLEAGLWLAVVNPSADTPEVRDLSTHERESVAVARNNDLNVWRDPDVRRLIRDRGIQLVAIRDLWDYDECRLRS